LEAASKNPDRSKHNRNRSIGLLSRIAACLVEAARDAADDRYRHAHVPSETAAAERGRVLGGRAVDRGRDRADEVADTVDQRREELRRRAEDLRGRRKDDARAPRGGEAPPRRDATRRVTTRE
jgi:hypothetical protein